VGSTVLLVHGIGCRIQCNGWLLQWFAIIANEVLGMETRAITELYGEYRWGPCFCFPQFIG
jgi:hypothetical protein